MKIEWVEDAVCRGQSDFIEMSVQTQRLACRACPVRPECLADELRYARHDNNSSVHLVRGGFTALERLQAVRDAGGDLNRAYRTLNNRARAKSIA